MSRRRLRAVLWDVDGTLAETERDGHLVAWNDAFATLGVPWRWSEARYGELLHITGGYERLMFDLEHQPQAPHDRDERETLARRIHAHKNAAYAKLVADGAIDLRPGVRELMDDCAQAGVPMAIATTTSRDNVEVLLRANLGADWRRRFAAVVTADEAPRKKPDPQVYLLALQHLGLGPGETLAIEDSPAGVAAADAAGIAVIVTRSRFFGDGPVSGTLASGPALGTTAGWTPAVERAAGRVGLAQLRAWHEEVRRVPAPG